MDNSENEKRILSNPPAESLSSLEKGKKTQVNQNSYQKLRYLLILENVLIVLAFGLFIVVYFNYTSVGTINLMIVLYTLLGLALLICGIATFLRIVKLLSRKDLPVYQNFLDDENVDPETGLYYYDVFSGEVEDAMQISLINCYLASFQLEVLNRQVLL